MSSDKELTRGLYRRILFCTDFSQNADYAFEFALDTARRRPGTLLYLLHVIPEPDAQFWKTYIYEVDNIDEKAKQDIDAKVAQAYLSRVPPEVRLETEFRVGKDYSTILEFAREKAVDLIILGRHGHSTLEDMLFGSVTAKVARKAECPVLIVPLSFRDRQATRSEDGD